MVLETHTRQIKSELFHKPDLTMNIELFRELRKLIAGSKKLMEARGSFLTR